MRAIKTDHAAPALPEYRGYARNNVGRAQDAIADQLTAVRLNPLDPYIWFPHGGLATSHFLLGEDMNEASSWAEKALTLRPEFTSALRTAMAAHALAGRLGAAGNHCRTYLRIEPEARLSSVAEMYRHRRLDNSLERFLEGLRLAGLPE